MVAKLKEDVAEKDSEIERLKKQVDWEEDTARAAAMNSLEAERDELRTTVERLNAELKAMTLDRNLWRDDHGDDCPYKAERDELRATVERLKAQVSDEDAERSFTVWNGWLSDATTWEELEPSQQERWKNAILASRSVPQEGQPAASPEEKPSICPKCNRPHYNMEDSAACREAAPEPSKEP